MALLCIHKPGQFRRGNHGVNIMARQVTTTVYQYSELSDKAKEKAREWASTVICQDDWWDSIYYDAENIGLRITSFGLDRNRHAEGEFIEGAESCAHKIEDEHGATCETYATAKGYLAERDRVINEAPHDEDGEFEDEYALDSELDEMDGEFLRSLLEDYSIMLQKENDAMYEDSYLAEFIEANAYEFTEDGKRA